MKTATQPTPKHHKIVEFIFQHNNVCFMDIPLSTNHRLLSLRFVMHYMCTEPLNQVHCNNLSEATWMYAKLHCQQLQKFSGKFSDII